MCTGIVLAVMVHVASGAACTGIALAAMVQAAFGTAARLHAGEFTENSLKLP